MKTTKTILDLSALALIFCFLAGCASFHEAGKKVWGSSIAHLEKARKDATKDEFSLPLDECFDKVESAIKAAGAMVYLVDKEKKHLAAMKFKNHVDTTEVGIFFTKVDERRTIVEVSSMSPGLKEEVAEVVTAALEEGFIKTKEKLDE
jgi:predicted oxidoreductase (fatty acid repression mutant protein)